MEYNKQETEQSVISGQMIIGVLLKNPSKIAECNLTPLMFWNQTDALIFGAMLEMNSSNTPIDVITVTENLLGKTGRDYLETLMIYATKGGGTEKNLKTYCEIITEAHRKTQAREIANLLTQTLHEPNAVEMAIRALMELTSENRNYEYDINEACKIGLTAIKDRAENKGKLPGVDTGLNGLNDTIGGFHKSDLVVIGARPAMGKTALILNMILRAKAKCGFISAEQGVSQIIQRGMAISGGVNSTNMRTGHLTEDDWDFLQAGCAKIKHHPGCWFYDKSSPTIEEVESIARRWKYEFGIEAFYIDYLQRLSVPPGKTKTEAVSENTRRLKDLARELGMPVVVLAQVKRDVESRNDKRPGMGDISDSSEVEKEADCVMMMYRDEYYNKDTTSAGIIELNIEKNRHGPTGCVPTKWSAQIMRISDLTDYTDGYH
jgi:replicative DNA helicase